MASFISRLVEKSGGTLPNAPADAFTDDNASVHQAAINALAAAGIVDGKGGGIYDPGGEVTRGQMASFIVRAYEYRSATTMLTTADHFADDNGTTHEENINKGAEVGITSGFADGTYGEAGFVTRDQMASFLARTLDLLVVNGFATLPPAQPVYLSEFGGDIEAVDKSTSYWVDGVVSIDGVSYPRGFSVLQNDGEIDFIEFDISRDYARLKTVVGMRDDSAQESTRFKVFGDGTELFTQDIPFGESALIDLDVSGVLRLRFEVINLAPSGSTGGAYPAFGDPAVFAF